jgi:hypothetical protein
MAKKTTPARSIDIVVEMNGQEYRGWYTVDAGGVSVHLAEGGSKATQVGSSHAEDIARLLMYELIDELKK